MKVRSPPFPRDRARESNFQEFVAISQCLVLQQTTPWRMRVTASMLFQQENIMKIQILRNYDSGKVGWVVLWLLGIPIPILLILFLVRGCT
jgi:hypothetical protein